MSVGKVLADTGNMFESNDDYHYALAMHKRISKYGDTPKSDNFFDHLMKKSADI